MTLQVRHEPPPFRLGHVRNHSGELTCGKCWEPLNVGNPIYWMPVGRGTTKAILCEPCGAEVMGLPLHDRGQCLFCTQPTARLLA